MYPLAAKSTFPYLDHELSLNQFPLHSGTIIRDCKLAYRIHGEIGRPLIIVLGGISAHRGLCDPSGEHKPWWKSIVGPDKVVNTLKYCVLGFDYLGGDADSTGPNSPLWPKGTKVSTYDQALALHEIVKSLGYRGVEAILGASYGAMIGLAFADLFPSDINRVIAISGAHRSHPMAMAWRYIQRQLLELADEAETTCNRNLQQRLVSLSRSLAMTTYRSPEEFTERFSNVSEVASYLESRGEAYAASRSHKSYYCLSESIDDHCVMKFSRHVDYHIIGFEEDRLVPSQILQELAIKSHGQLHLFHSLYGHDAFLKEHGILNRLLPKLLEGAL